MTLTQVMAVVAVIQFAIVLVMLVPVLLLFICMLILLSLMVMGMKIDEAAQFSYKPSITRLMERTTNCASRSRSSPVIFI